MDLETHPLIIHESSESISPAKTPFLNTHNSHGSSSFPIIAVAIIGILATAFLLVFYYIFVIKCCLNWHRIDDVLRRFSLSRSRNHRDPLIRHFSPAFENRGLEESVIRSIPIFQFRKQKNDDDCPDSDTRECAVCLSEFQQDEKLRMIPNCAHVFHIDCIDVWLQNNPNCPLCRTSISISMPTHLPRLDQQEVPPPTFDFSGQEEDYVVIEISINGGGGEGRNNGGEHEMPNSGEPTTISPSPRKVDRKMGRKARKKLGHVSSMGDECIDIVSKGKGDEQFLVQPIRRSFSMDSASDRQLYLAVQEIIQGKMMNPVPVDANEGCSSSTRLRRGLFSFGHARSAVLPLHLEQ